jgi:Fe-S cluster assembly protein SufD
MNASLGSNVWAQANFDLVERGLNGAKGGTLHALKAQSLKQFLSEGIPNTKDEEWRYSDLSELSKTDFQIPSNPAKLINSDISGFTLGLRHSLVFVDGYFSASLSSQLVDNEQIKISALDPFFHAKAEYAWISKAFNSTSSLHQRTLTSLNTALSQDGLAILVDNKGKELLDIEILHISTSQKEPSLITPRALIIVGEQSNVQVIERFIGLGSGSRFVCALTEILAAANSQVDYYSLIENSLETVQYHSIQAQIERDAQFRSHLFPLSGKLTRNEVNLNLIGSGSHATINGLSALKDNQQVDNSTIIRHAVPHCDSSQLFKGIYSDKSRGVFQGTIIVEKDAQKTNAFQSNQSILMSKEASVDTKPQLKIWADDVKCTHGATVGQLDEEALFYIKSRGIGSEVAKALLVEAFAGELLQGIKSQQLGEILQKSLHTKLG